jgi:hypothetical protein
MKVLISLVVVLLSTSLVADATFKFYTEENDIRDFLVQMQMPDASKPSLIPHTEAGCTEKLARKVMALVAMGEQVKNIRIEKDSQVFRYTVTFRSNETTRQLCDL